MLKISSPTPPASSRKQARRPARLELVDPVQRQPHRVFVDLAADRHLHALGRPCGLPSAREAQELAQHRDDEDEAHQRDQACLGRFRERDGAPGHELAPAVDAPG